ncbi:YbaN family protein [Haliea sp.]|uniref:YbaN family protein n=1 Tax=Haliea sp. TaxID=1932666 RepID=UPI003529A94A
MHSFFWRFIAVIALLLAAVGILLPIMPTVPFLLVATWAASRGWPELNDWLLNHPDYGPHIIAWQDNGAVSRRAKWLATLMLGGSTTLLWLSGAPVMFAAIITTVFVVVLTWLWWRPEP